MAIVLPKFPRRRASGIERAESLSENRPLIALGCCRPDRRYAAGALLEGNWQINLPRTDTIQGIEASVLWFTEGKGDEDLTVHFFRRWSANRLSSMDLTIRQTFRTQLPYSPMTYNGHLLRIRWCIRLRLFPESGRDLVAELPFIMDASTST